ncbi:MAG: universal stress protein [Actinomycetota bacterium]|nr:universal stress protein [Actinomycetota bacterium]
MTLLGAAAPIVVGIDGSPSSNAALDWAVDEAQRRGHPLSLVSAWGTDVISDPLGPVLAAFDAECRAALDAAQARVIAAAPGVPVTTLVARDRPAAALVAASETADTVVLGSRGLGALRGAFAGSTSMHLAAHAACPVVVVRETGSDDPTSARVVVGVDGSEASTDAVEYAFAQASHRGLGLTAVHAWALLFTPGVLGSGTQAEVLDQIGTQEAALAAESLAGWAEKYPDVDVRSHTVNGHVVDELADASRGAALIVVGHRGRGGFAGLLLGSVAQGLLHRAHCPVAVVRARRRDGVRRPG